MYMPSKLSSGWLQITHSTIICEYNLKKRSHCIAWIFRWLIQYAYSMCVLYIIEYTDITQLYTV